MRVFSKTCILVAVISVATPLLGNTSTSSEAFQRVCEDLMAKPPASDTCVVEERICQQRHFLSNLMASLSATSCSDATRALAGMTKLRLRSSKIADASILATLPQITDIDLADNAITDMTPLLALPNLTILNLSRNQIAALPSSGHEKLQVLRLDRQDLGDNTFALATLNRYPALRVLSLAHLARAGIAEALPLPPSLASFDLGPLSTSDLAGMRGQSIDTAVLKFVPSQQTCSFDEIPEIVESRRCQNYRQRQTLDKYEN